MQMQWFRRQAAGRLDARPEAAQGTQLRDAGEEISISSKPERDHAPRRVEIHAGGFEPAQM